MQPTRFEINGVRHYRAGDNPDKAYASVTSILGRTSPPKEQQSLRDWNIRNPGAKEAAAARGTLIHAACEDYIRGKPVNVPDDIRPFWNGLSQHLDKFDYFVWSEKPLLPQWSNCTGADGISRIWSHEFGYAGCPDLIGVRNGVTILADFKTSNGPYTRFFPKEPDQGTFGGWKKFRKCSVQLAAYAIACQETLGLKIDCAQILVSTPEIDQSFYLHGDDLQHYRCIWLQKVRKYQEILAEEAAEQAQLDAMAGPCRVLQSA